MPNRVPKTVPGQIIEFLRKKDLVFKEELGRGACGKTVILYDPVIEEHFVCKKYAPAHEPLKEELFQNFVREIKLLHLLNHPNVVRVFNYYVYAEQHAGYILMELVQGSELDEYLNENPEHTNDVFLQTIEGFVHLEKHEILHRDIRPANILVTDGGLTKIIDFGFRKQVSSQHDFGKSISLNWWCEPPLDFDNHTYDFKTEVYFVGKLFEKIIRDCGIDEFAYKGLLSRMCAYDPAERVQSFTKIRQEILAGRFADIPFSQDELHVYRMFAADLSDAVSKIERSAKYADDIDKIERALADAHLSVMLEEYVPSNVVVVRCFIKGAYYFSSRQLASVANLRGFLELLRSCSREKKEIILSNIHTRLDTITRYDEPPPDFDDDIPF